MEVAVEPQKIVSQPAVVVKTKIEYRGKTNLVANGWDIYGYYPSCCFGEPRFWAKNKFWDFPPTVALMDDLKSVIA